MFCVVLGHLSHLRYNEPPWTKETSLGLNQARCRRTGSDTFMSFVLESEGVSYVESL
jgi:hypothetical protein